MNIVICDDQPLYRRGLAAVAAELQPGASVTEVANGDELAEIGAAAEKAALVMVNADMIGASPALSVDQLRRRFSQAAVVLVAPKIGRAEADRFVAQGVAGIVLRSDPPARILSGLRHVMAGGLLLPTEIFSEPRPSEETPSTGVRESAQALLGAMPGEWTLTRRQAAVLALIGRGWSNRRIADELGVSEGTVKVHVNAVLKVLKVKNRTEAALQLSKRGFGGSSRRR